MTGAHHRPERRRRIFAVTGGRCLWCGRELAKLPKLERQLDHLVPGAALLLRRGRWRRVTEDNTDPNLAPCCGACNRAKHGRTEEEWAEELEERRAMEDDGPADLAPAYECGAPF